MAATDITPSSAAATIEPSPALAPAAVGAPLVDWLVRQALPMWSTTGVDRRHGGYFEKIDLRGRPVEEARRARVVARQVYVFATAARRGWLNGADALVDHGLRFLAERLRLADGSYAAAVQVDGSAVRPGFDLYEHAFVLFALAAARRGRPDRDAARLEAEALLRQLRGRWAHPTAGFEEGAPRTLPLKSNPHMHLFEAALAWAEISTDEGAAVWNALADELAGLCLTHFIDADSGALREYFNGDWRPMPGAAGRVVEPGHQFEWAWLLLRWGQLRRRPDALAAARRLLHVGEAHGIDAGRGVAVNELDAVDLRVVDAAAKLWPQTERIKAWHAAWRSSADANEAKAAEQRLRAAVDGLRRYVIDAPAGLWHEQMNADGGFALQSSRASSLYHIVCAVDTVHDPSTDDAREPLLGAPRAPG